MAITITIDNKTLGLDDFVERWTWGLSSITCLGNDMAEIDELSAMQRRVKKLAVKRFFELYQEEQLEKDKAFQEYDDALIKIRNEKA
tara:strand:+ start:63 stop:323 length:261 start_codon:yes stop_codon:yes gene_type:complete